MTYLGDAHSYTTSHKKWRISGGMYILINILHYIYIHSESNFIFIDFSYSYSYISFCKLLTRLYMVADSVAMLKRVMYETYQLLYIIRKTC